MKKKTRVNKIREHIKYIHLEGIDETIVPTDDLVELDKRIAILEDQLRIAKIDVAIIDAKLSLCQLDKPIRFDVRA